MNDVTLTVQTVQLGVLEIPQATSQLTVQTAESVVIEVSTAPATLEVLTAETVVIEIPTQQGPPGPGGGLDEQAARDIATEEVTEVRVDYDALVAAALFQ